LQTKAASTKQILHTNKNLLEKFSIINFQLSIIWHVEVAEQEQVVAKIKAPAVVVDAIG